MIKKESLFLYAGLGLIGYYLYDRAKNDPSGEGLSGTSEVVVDSLMPLLKVNPIVRPFISKGAKSLLKNFEKSNVIEAQYKVIRD